MRYSRCLTVLDIVQGEARGSKMDEIEASGIDRAGTGGEEQLRTLREMLSASTG